MLTKNEALMLFFTVLITFSSQAVSIADDRSDWVIDQAGILGADFFQVEEAIARLRATGADAYALVINEAYPYCYFLKVFEETPAWGNPKNRGQRKRNLIVFIVSVSSKGPETTIVYGLDWQNALQKEWKRIELEIINSKVRRGHPAIGLISGIDETSNIIKSYLYEKEISEEARAIPDSPDISLIKGAILFFSILGALTLIVRSKL